jgi:hypothetical protein
MAEAKLVWSPIEFKRLCFGCAVEKNYPSVVGSLSIVADALADHATACLEETTQEKRPLLPAA